MHKAKEILRRLIESTRLFAKSTPNISFPSFNCYFLYFFSLCLSLLISFLVAPFLKFKFDEISNYILIISYSNSIFTLYTGYNIINMIIMKIYNVILRKKPTPKKIDLSDDRNIVVEKDSSYFFSKRHQVYSSVYNNMASKKVEVDIQYCGGYLWGLYYANPEIRWSRDITKLSHHHGISFVVFILSCLLFTP